MALISTSRKRFGLKFEEKSVSTFGLEHLAKDRFALGSIPESFSHEGDIPIRDGRLFLLNQKSTSTCVSHAFMHAVILKERRDGLPFDQPSVLFPYWNSRKEHGGQWFDSGTYLYTLGTALRKFGTPSEQFWKFGQFSGRVNRRPNWRAHRKAHPRRGGKYVRIYETGEDRVPAVQQALLNGYDVAFGTRLGKSFVANDGPILVDKPPPSEAIVGNHAMLIIGWQHFGGKRYFRVLNSWGRDWRDGGGSATAPYLFHVEPDLVQLVHPCLDHAGRYLDAPDDARRGGDQDVQVLRVDAALLRGIQDSGAFFDLDFLIVDSELRHFLYPT